MEKNGQLFLKSLLKSISSKEPCAAYIGASNGNQNEFFQIFKSAMKGIGIKNCRMIGLDFSLEDRYFIEKSDIILLAGGDVFKGWKIIQSTGLKESVIAQYRKGTVIISVSAGTEQLGLCGIDLSPINQNSTIDFFQINPHVIGVNEEKENWANLKTLVVTKEGSCSRIGIPLGGGAIHYPDNTIELIRKSIYEVIIKNKITACNLICENDESKAANLCN